ncbi:MAG: hypothetical protein ACK4YP_13145 [Myxococcota bacterium]
MCSLLLAVLFVGVPDATAGGLTSQLQSAPEMVWLGLDYSRVRIFTPEQFDNPEQRVFWDPGGGLGDTVTRFKKPKDAFDQLVADWNSMAVHDHLEDLEKALQREITVDLPTPAGQTQRKGDVFFESVYDAKSTPVELNQTVIQEMVKKYKIKAKKGVGLVFVMDRLSQPDKEVCAWPTYIELEKKTVLATERVCEKPGGSGYRNYWFNIIPAYVKDVTKAIKKGDF